MRAAKPASSLCNSATSKSGNSVSVAVVGGVMGFLVIGEAVVIIALLLIMIQRKGNAQNE